MKLCVRCWAIPSKNRCRRRAWRRKHTSLWTIRQREVQGFLNSLLQRSWRERCNNCCCWFRSWKHIRDRRGLWWFGCCWRIDDNHKMIWGPCRWLQEEALHNSRRVCGLCPNELLHGEVREPCSLHASYGQMQIHYGHLQLGEQAELDETQLLREQPKLHISISLYLYIRVSFRI